MDLNERKICILKRTAEIKKSRLSRKVKLLGTAGVALTAALMIAICQNVSLNVGQIPNGYCSMIVQGDAKPDTVIAITAYFAGVFATAILLNFRSNRRRKKQND
ncbi:MAG: hypothetical protein PUB87_05860 [Eubacteriaceae bacterium]|nr:hypothetical protein [Eubacteriaceae bacterium]